MRFSTSHALLVYNSISLSPKSQSIKLCFVNSALKDKKEDVMDQLHIKGKKTLLFQIRTRRGYLSLANENSRNRNMISKLKP